MRFLAIVSLCLFMAGISLLFLAGEGSELSISTSTLDLGSADQGRSLPFEFRVTNKTSDRLEIVGVSGSCACMILSDLSNVLVEPHASLAIRGKLDTVGRRGPVEARVLVTYRTGPSAPERHIPLAVRAFVRPVFDINPGRLIFLTSLDHQGQKLSRDVVITTKDRASRVLPEVETSASWITAQWVDRGTPGEQVEARGLLLRVTLDPAGMDGESIEPEADQRVRIWTTSRSDPVLAIPVQVQLRE